MINVKAQVYQAIKDIAGNVSDGYPKDWADLPAIQYTEEENVVSVWADNKEVESQLRYRIDIWNNQSTSDAMLAVDEAVSRLGLRRTMCTDVDDPSGLKHKVMRYEGIINIEDERVYQRNL
jgi:hypothetical protein